MNYLLQRYVVKTVPTIEPELERHKGIAAKHLQNYVERYGRAPRLTFEFGSGMQMMDAILLGMKGCKVVASDVRSLSNRFLLDNMLQRLGAESLESINVRYIAPLDARHTPFPDGHFDLIVSAMVLEHIPPDVIQGIMRECRRLLSAQGICSFYIDYIDHWSYIDPSISHLNFLRYEPRAWKFMNPAIHYQNRLRHSDYVAIFEQAGFRIASVEPERLEIPPVPLASQFRRASDLDITRAWFVLE